MSSEPTLRLFDNPIRIAQARRRMRRRQTVPTLAVIGLCCLSALLFAGTSEAGVEVWRGTRDFLLLGMLALLCYRGTLQVSTTLAEDQSSGLLDFHRATPTSAWTDALGYALGCSAREYAGALLVAPFFVVASLFAGSSLTASLLTLYVVWMATLVCHAYGMLTGLTVKGRRAGQSIATVLAALFLIAYATSSVEYLGLAHATPLPALVSLGCFSPSGGGPPALTFFGVPCSHVTYTILLQGFLLVFLVWCTARKLRSEFAHAFTRPGALVFFGCALLLLVGPVWSGMARREILAAGVAAFLGCGLIFASVLAVSLVPSYLESVRTIRRARRFRRRPRWRETGASAWPLVPLFFVILTAGATLFLERARQLEGLAGFEGFDGVAGVAGELAVAGVACLVFLAFEVGAFEYFRLEWRKSARSGIFLVAFASFALPWILGSASAPILGDSGASHVLFATSPLYGVFVSAKSLAGALAGFETVTSGARLTWSLFVTLALAGGFWAAALRARARIEVREIETGDLPSIDAYRTAG